MKERPPSGGTPNAASGHGAGLGAATEHLFMEIADASGNEVLRRSMVLMSQQMQAIRPYEEDLIPDREAEFDTLSACWAARDIPRLQILIMAYFKRRQDLAPKVAELINRPRS